MHINVWSNIGLNIRYTVSVLYCTSAIFLLNSKNKNNETLKILIYKNFEFV
jgi:hypothetical protein